jgi:hypothetical protein
MFWNYFTISDKRAAMIIWLYGKERIREDAGCCLVLLQFSPPHNEMIRFTTRVMQRTGLPEVTNPDPIQRCTGQRANGIAGSHCMSTVSTPECTSRRCPSAFSDIPSASWSR